MGGNANRGHIATELEGEHGKKSAAQADEYDCAEASCPMAELAFSTDQSADKDG
jgi:hypothetical protein